MAVTEPLDDPVGGSGVTCPLTGLLEAMSALALIMSALHPKADILVASADFRL
jgi:hypothetical protein